MKDKKRDIYYEYLSINNYDVKYHLVSIDSIGYHLLIPSNYYIKYSRSTNNYDGIGHIQFYTEKNKYTLDYSKKDYQTFKYLLSTLSNNYSKQFINYRKQEFYEIIKDKADTIYMYAEGYMYKLSSEHKLNINEYFDMYFILFSITNSIIQENVELLKELQLLMDKGISSFCNDEDLLILDLSQMQSDYELNKSDVIISSDEEYLSYKEKKRKVELLGYNVLANLKEKELTIVYNDNKWKINGTFFLGILGYYHEGCLSNYDEIIQSKELTEEDKISLLSTMLKQRQIEASTYEDTIREEFYHYLSSYLLEHFNYELWDKYHFRDFINLNVLSDEYASLSDLDIYNLFYSYIETNHDIKSLFKYKDICSNINGENIIIYPDHYEIIFSGFNYLLDSVHLIINEEYLIEIVE